LPAATWYARGPRPALRHVRLSRMTCPRTALRHGSGSSAACSRLRCRCCQPAPGPCRRGQRFGGSAGDVESTARRRCSPAPRSSGAGAIEPGTGRRPRQERCGRCPVETRRVICSPSAVVPGATHRARGRDRRIARRCTVGRAWWRPPRCRAARRHLPGAHGDRLTVGEVVIRTAGTFSGSCTCVADRSVEPPGEGAGPSAFVSPPSRDPATGVGDHSSTDRHVVRRRAEVVVTPAHDQGRRRRCRRGDWPDGRRRSRARRRRPVGLSAHARRRPPGARVGGRALDGRVEGRLECALVAARVGCGAAGSLDDASFDDASLDDASLDDNGLTHSSARTCPRP
jgi:hypothetical protein